MDGAYGVAGGCQEVKRVKYRKKQKDGGYGNAGGEKAPGVCSRVG